MSLVIIPDMLRLISELDSFKTAWKNLTTLSPHKLEHLRKVATIESVASSTRIEGAKLSDAEVETLLSRLDIGSFASRDEEEVAGYAEIMNIILPFYEDIQFTENYIKQLHKVLLKFSRKDEAHRGEYKKLSNNIVAYDADGREIGIIFETSSAFDTPFEMKQLVEWTQQQLKEKYYHPLLVIGMFVVRFLAIHPFQDGNGRLSRILTTLLLLKEGYHYVQYSSLESIIELNKKEYYASLRRTQLSLKAAQPDYESWLLFFLRSLQKQKHNLENKLTQDAVPATIDLSEKETRVINYARHLKGFQVSDISRDLELPYNTAKKVLLSLVHKKLLEKYGKGRGVWYRFSQPIQ